LNTLLLDRTAWDFVLDANHNIAMASDPYSVAQDVASSVRTFIGECWYDTTRGIPYFQQILGQSPPLSYIKTQIAAAAALVPGCANPVVFISSAQNRVLSGQVQFTDSNTGAVQAVAFGPEQVQLYTSSANAMTDNAGNPIFGSS
jgi:hypothetical protein